MSQFFKQFLLNYKKTGAITASSDHLGMAFIDAANLVQAKTVVELGPGTGALTEKILEHINPSANFFAIEINKHFVKSTQKRCPDVPVYHDSAHNLTKYLKRHGVRSCDCVISGLPWTLFNKSTQYELLNAIQKGIEPWGEFLTFAYVHGLLLPNGKFFRQKLNRNFKDINTSRIVWKNTPPAVVYHAFK